MTEEGLAAIKAARCRFEAAHRAATDKGDREAAVAALLKSVTGERSARARKSASWLNAVEGFFATLTKRRLKRGVFRSVELQAAINRFLEEHNQKSLPFTWTADPDEIIAAVRRGHQAFNSIH